MVLVSRLLYIYDDDFIDPYVPLFPPQTCTAAKELQNTKVERYKYLQGMSDFWAVDVSIELEDWLSKKACRTAALHSPARPGLQEIHSPDRHLEVSSVTTNAITTCQTGRKPDNEQHEPDRNKYYRL